MVGRSIAEGKVDAPVITVAGARSWYVLEVYRKNQLEKDYMSDQMTMKEYTDPFTGSKNNKA